MPEVITTEQLKVRIEEVLGDMVKSKGENWQHWPNFRLANGVFVEFKQYRSRDWQSDYTGVNINIGEDRFNKTYMRLKYDKKREGDKHVDYVKFDSDKLLKKVSDIAANIIQRQTSEAERKQRTAEAKAKTIALFPDHVIDNEFHLEPTGTISVTGSEYRYEGQDLTIKGDTYKDPSYVRIAMEMSVPLSELDSFITKMQTLVDDGNQKET